MSYLKGASSTRVTPQRERIPGREDQVANSEGGFVWQLKPIAQLRRFLILGASGGTFYVNERKLVKENHAMLLAAIDVLGTLVVDEIVAVSEEGRAPRNDEALWALAVCASYGTRDMGDEVREGAWQVRDRALRSLPRVARTGSHLFQFVSYAIGFRGWGPQLRRAVAAWYEGKDADALAYQMVKYRQRHNWTHRGVLQEAHPTPPTAQHDSLFRWASAFDEPKDHYKLFVPRRLTGQPGEMHDHVRPDGRDELIPPPPQVHLYEGAQRCTTPQMTAQLVRDAGGDLPREALRPEHLTDPGVWEAMLEVGMPMTALLRNLGNLSRNGVLKPLGTHTTLVCEQLTDAERLRKARVHPLSVLFALATYRSGQGFRGTNRWEVVPEVVDALDTAFYVAFGNVQPAHQRFLLGLDVSGSMRQPIMNSNVECMEAAAAMAMVTHRTELASHVFAFDHGMRPVAITAKKRLDDVIRSLPRNYGGTDCALPMIYALQNELSVDTFCVYTDNETHSGQMHPSQALQLYREQTGIDAKLIVVGMTSTGFTIADPKDAGMLDVVGFDTATPQILTAFARGEV